MTTIAQTQREQHIANRLEWLFAANHVPSRVRVQSMGPGAYAAITPAILPELTAEIGLLVGAAQVEIRRDYEQRLSAIAMRGVGL